MKLNLCIDDDNKALLLVCLQVEVVGNTYRGGYLMRRQAGGLVVLQPTTEMTDGKKCEF